jgi:hypothetical protein
MQKTLLAVVILLTAALLIAGPTFSQEKPNPSLKDTLRWMQTSSAAQGHTFQNGEDRSTQLTKFSGCQVTIVYTTTKDWKETYHQEVTFDLSDIDSDTGLFGDYKNVSDGFEGLGLFTAITRNDEEKIHFKVPTTNLEFDDSGLIFTFHSEYGHKFSKAFRHAVNLCGGKPSLF